MKEAVQKSSPAKTRIGISAEVVLEARSELIMVL